MNVWWDVKQVTPPKKELLSQTEICWATFEVRNGAIQIPRWNFKGRLLRNSLSSSKCPPPMDLTEHLPGWGQGQGLIGTLERGHLVKRTPVELFCAAVEFLFTPNPPSATCHCNWNVGDVKGVGVDYVANETKRPLFLSSSQSLQTVAERNRKISVCWLKNYLWSNHRCGILLSERRDLTWLCSSLEETEELQKHLWMLLEDLHQPKPKQKLEQIFLLLHQLCSLLPLFSVSFKLHQQLVA